MPKSNHSKVASSNHFTFMVEFLATEREFSIAFNIQFWEAFEKAVQLLASETL